MNSTPTNPAESDELVREVRRATEDYRRVFPEPYSLSPNLALAVRAVAEVERWRAAAVAAFDGNALIQAAHAERDHAIGRADRLNQIVDSIIELCARAEVERRGLQPPGRPVISTQELRSILGRHAGRVS